MTVGQPRAPSDLPHEPPGERDLVTPSVSITLSPSGEVKVRVGVPDRDPRVYVYRVWVERLVGNPMGVRIPEGGKFVAGSWDPRKHPFAGVYWMPLRRVDRGEGRNVYPGSTAEFDAPNEATIFRVWAGVRWKRPAAVVWDRAFWHLYTAGLSIKDGSGDPVLRTVFETMLASKAERIWPGMVFPWALPDLRPPVMTSRLISNGEPRTCHSMFEIRLVEPAQVAAVLDPQSEVFWVVEESPDAEELGRSVPGRYERVGDDGVRYRRFSANVVSHWVDLYRLMSFGRKYADRPMQMRTPDGVGAGIQMSDDPMVALLTEDDQQLPILRMAVPANVNVSIRGRFVTRWGSGRFSPGQRLIAERSDRQARDDIVEPYTNIVMHPNTGRRAVSTVGVSGPGVALVPETGYLDTVEKVARQWRTAICQETRVNLSAALREYGPGRLAVEIYRRLVPADERNRMEWRVALWAGLRDMDTSQKPPETIQLIGAYNDRFSRQPLVDSLGEGAIVCSAANYLDALKGAIMEAVVEPYTRDAYTDFPGMGSLPVSLGRDFVAVVHSDNTRVPSRMRRRTMRRILRGEQTTWEDGAPIGVCHYPERTMFRELAAWSIGRLTPEEDRWVTRTRLGDRQIVVGASDIGTSALGEWPDVFHSPATEPNYPLRLWYMLAAVSGATGPMSSIERVNRVGYVPTAMLPLLTNQVTREMYSDWRGTLRQVRFVGPVGMTARESVPGAGVLESLLVRWKYPDGSEIVPPCTEYDWEPTLEPEEPLDRREIVRALPDREWTTENSVVAVLAALGFVMGGVASFRGF